MKELEAKLAELEGKVTAFFGKVDGGVGGAKAEVAAVDEGPLAGLDAVNGKVASVRGFLEEQLGKVEAKAKSIRPE